MITSPALAISSRLLKLFAQGPSRVFLSASSQIFKFSVLLFLDLFLLYSFSSSAAPDQRGEASMQLRTRLTTANTPMEYQTKVRVGHDRGLFQGEMQNSANCRPLHFCMVGEAAG